MATVEVKLTVHVENMFTTQQVFDLVHDRLDGTELTEYGINSITALEGEFQSDRDIIGKLFGYIEDSKEGYR